MELKYRQMLSTIAVLALVLAACGGGSVSSGTESGVSSTEAQSSSTTASSSTTSTTTTSTTVAPPTSMAATTAPPTTAAGIDKCLIGHWSLDSPTFVESLNQSMGSGVPGEFVYESGDYTLDISAPNQVSTQRQEWKLKITSSEGDLVMTVDDTSPSTGTWTADSEAGTLSVDMSGTETNITMQANVNGSLVDIPTGSANVSTPQGALSGQGTYQCSPDHLITINQGVRAVWNRQS